mgnify:CR=1 FL=1
MKERHFPAVFLLVSLVTVPFVMMATLLYQYRLDLHDRHHVLQDDLAVFAAGLRASGQVTALSPWLCRLGTLALASAVNRSMGLC